MGLPSNHFSLTSAQDVTDICKPLNCLFNFRYFEFIRIFSDGSRASLSNAPEILEASYFKGDTFEHVYFPDYYKEGSSIALLKEDIRDRPANIRQKYEGHIKVGMDQFQLDNEVHFVKKYQHYADCFAYAGYSMDESFLPALMSQIDLLKRFHIYFQTQASDLIEQALKDRVVAPWREEGLEVADVTNRDEFLDLTKLERLKLPGSDAYLSKAEIRILSFLVRGITNAKCIAAACHLSSRTIETHLSNIKAKLGCQYNHELVVKVQTMGLGEYFLDMKHLSINN